MVQSGFGSMIFVYQLVVLPHDLYGSFKPKQSITGINIANTDSLGDNRISKFPLEPKHKNSGVGTVHNQQIEGNTALNVSGQ